MEEIKEKVEEEVKEMPTIFRAFCFKCYSFTDIPEEENLTKECEERVEESIKLYRDRRAMKKLIRNGCQKCHKDLVFAFNDYLQFYEELHNPKTEEIVEVKEEKVENESEIIEGE